MGEPMSVGFQKTNTQNSNKFGVEHHESHLSRFVFALIAAVSLAAIAWPLHAAPPMEVKVQLDIPAQDLSSSLTQFGRDAGVEIEFAPDAVKTKKAAALKGEFEKGRALELLLKDSGLTYRITAQGAFVVEPAHTTGTESSARPELRTAALDSASQADTESLMEKLDEVVVTAQKREERLRDVPISISVLGGTNLDKASFQGVADALNTVPGVIALGSVQSGGTQIIMRGVGAGGPLFTGSSPIAYYVDAVPFGFVKSAIVPDPNIYDQQRIEVLRGPQGTLYGANAENGVVRVLTNDANPNAFELKARTLLSTTEGGGGNYGGDMAINVPVIEGKLAVRAVIDYQNLSGWINSPVKNHVNDAELRSYRLKINAQPTDALSIALSAWSTRNDYGAPSASTDDRRISAVIPEPNSTNYDVYGFKFGYEFSDFSLSSVTSYLDYKNEGVLDFSKYLPGIIPPGTPYFPNFYAHVFSEEMILNSAATSAWRWTVGTFYRDGSDRLLAILRGILPAPLDDTYISKSYAVFGQLGRRFLNNRLEWALGLRYFHDDVSTKENVQGQGLPNVPLIHDTASFNSTTPRAVLTWYPTTEWMVYASYSEGFRSGFPQDPGVIQAAPGIMPAKPDKLHNYEIGTKADIFDKRVSLDTALYFTDWKDIQQLITVPYGAGGVPVAALVNGQSASGIGADFAIKIRPVEGLELGANFGWNDLTMDADVISAGALLFSKGDRLNFSPEFTSGLSADYTFPIGGDFSAQISASANYSSRQTDHLLVGNAVNVLKGDNLFVARVSVYIEAPSNWSVRLYADNITNNYGGIPAFGFAVPELSPRPRPRTLGMQLEYHF